MTGELGREAFDALLALTDVQIRTLYSILDRETYEQMALRLVISPEAGRSRRKTLYRKLGVRGERGVLRWAVECGLVTPGQVIDRIINGGTKDWAEL